MKRRALRSTFVGLALLALSGAARADRIAILDSAIEALDGRIHLLESATSTIDVLYFAIHDDEVTRTTLGLLREKALQGIRVRVITNPRAFKVDPAIRFYLQTLHDFEIRVFDNPVAGRFKFLRQLHDKLILVDGDRYITGGRNLGAAYFDLHEKTNKKDRDVYVLGSSSATAQEYFDDLWESTEVSPATFAPYSEATMAPGYCDTVGAARDSFRYRHCQGALAKRRESVDRGVREMERLLEEVREDEAYQQAAASPVLDFWEIEDRYVTFVHDHVEKEKVQTAEELDKLLRRADASVLVQTPYLVPDPEFEAVLEEMQRNGVRLEVLTNSVKSTVNVIATAATERYKKRFLDYGVIFYESTGDDMLHAKSAVYRARASDDGGPPCWGAVGSFNGDPRSAYLNTETVVVVRDCAFADELETTIRSYMEDTVRVAGRDDLAASRALKKEIPFVKRLLLGLFKLLTPLYRSQI